MITSTGSPLAGLISFDYVYRSIKISDVRWDVDFRGTDIHGGALLLGDSHHSPVFVEGRNPGDRPRAWR